MTEKTPIASDIIGITSFGILNGFSHVVIKRNSKKTNGDTVDNRVIPQLILVSGRTEQNVQETISKVINEYK